MVNVALSSLATDDDDDETKPVLVKQEAGTSLTLIAKNTEQMLNPSLIPTAPDVSQALICLRSKIHWRDSTTALQGKVASLTLPTPSVPCAPHHCDSATNNHYPVLKPFLAPEILPNTLAESKRGEDEDDGFSYDEDEEEAAAHAPTPASLPPPPILPANLPSSHPLFALQVHSRLPSTPRPSHAAQHNND